MRVQDRRMLKEDGKDHCTLGVNVSENSKRRGDEYLHILIAKL